uniref:Lipase_3 domain-containing protein n=1 Tax=Panagrellus redivivus TaxID=6233 RepID=A0A7E4VF72_PANRE
MLSLAVFCVLIAVSAGSYDESLARNKLAPLAGAAYTTIPGKCLSNAFTRAELIKQVIVPCENDNTDTCSGFVAVSHGDKAVIVSFRGTMNIVQLLIEGANTVFSPKVPFPAGGKVGKYFFNGYTSTWQGGLKDSFLNATKNYPDYSIWLTGHSLGGALATLAATEIVSNGYVPANKVKLYTFGQPRVGDSAFAMAHDKLGFESYRIIHAGDLVPHIPFGLFDDYTQHKSEIWYNNRMGVNSNYDVCEGQKRSSCSDNISFFRYRVSDHLNYFDRSVSGFGEDSCIAGLHKNGMQQRSGDLDLDEALDAQVNAIWKQKYDEMQKAAAAKNITFAR